MRRLLHYFGLGCVAASLFSIAVPSIGQPEHNRLVLYSISEQQGLSDNRVTCFYQDDRGFMWIGSQDGLSRYDGSLVTSYKHRKNDSTSLAANHVTGITSDENNELWISTLDGLCRYDPIHDRFETYRASVAFNNPNLMWDVVADGNGNLWIASEVGLLQFIINQKKFLLHRIQSGFGDATLRRANWVTKISIDRQKRFWLSTHYGLWRFLPGENEFEPAVVNTDKKFDDLVNTVFSDHAGNVWMGTWGEGLKKFNPETKQVERIIDSHIRENVFGIAEIKDERGQYSIWCSDLVQIDEQRHIKKYLPSSIEPSRSFVESRFYASRDGLLWITSLTGAKIVDPSRQFFTHHFLARSEISSQQVSLLEKDSLQFYIGGQAGEFLKLYDSRFNVVKDFPMSSELRSGSVEGPSVLRILREDESHLWLCTENGIVLLNENDGRQKVFRLSSTQINTHARNFFTSMLIDRKERCWVFPWRSGIWLLNRETGSFKQMQLSLPEDSTKKFVVSSAVEDHRGKIWLADLDIGLLSYDEKRNSFLKFKPNELGDRYAISKLEFIKPYLWMVRAGEIIRVNTDTNQINRWSIPDDFNKTVSDFCNDNSGHLWISTSSGLIAFDKSDSSFVRYRSSDGLMDDNMDGVFASLHDGRILFFMENYVTEFKPSKLSKPLSSRAVVITRVLAQNKKISIHSHEKKDFLDFDYTYSNFKFNWALLNYSNPLENQYYCKLDGVDKDWKYVGNVGFAEYASLPPGDYTFHARGVTSDGVKGIVDDSVRIIIHPPFWETWWFLILLVAFVCFAALALYRYRVNQLLLREKMRTKIATDLHDDIGSTLSSISILGDLAYQQLSPGKTATMVKEIRDNAQMLMEKMDDIVWGINPTNDSLEKLFLRLKKFAAQVLEASDIEYVIDIKPAVRQIRISMEHRQHIYLILKEAINNLVKHARCKKASLSIDQEHDYLILKVQDDGIGFNISSEQDGNGLASLRRRAQAMKAELNILSSSAGTLIELKAKIH
jgi:streptogramin lyase/two-component sensor histidine kinase